MRPLRRISPVQLLLLGIALAALPLSAVSLQLLRLNSGVHITVPARILATQNDVLVPLAVTQTPLRHVSLEDLTGDNNFKVGDMAYLYVSRSGVQVYPFAISRQLPTPKRHAQPSTASVPLRAVVISKQGDSLELEFPFDKISPPQSFIQAVNNDPLAPVRLTLAISPDGLASVSAFHVGNKSFDQRVMTKADAPGFSMTIASMAPPI